MDSRINCLEYLGGEVTFASTFFDFFMVFHEIVHKGLLPRKVRFLQIFWKIPPGVEQENVNLKT